LGLTGLPKEVEEGKEEMKIWVCVLAGKNQKTVGRPYDHV
jgi:hypothetical protein